MSRMTEQIGRVLGGRYRLLAPLGAGASAQVYLADDVRLRRRVAAKVLHAALADDESFLRRFRAEAQAAAALSHPHILAVYDWSGGEDSEEGTPYLVTEYLSGGSLRSMLDSGYRLTRSQALVVGLEAARALDHAHRQGFVHRDVKPANLLFGDDGRLRVADFGLARAIAEAGWTEPHGAVLGTARYASPEQARGESVDGRSDVYSLALVLVEAVTGQVPFTADTTIATLMARLDRSLPVPDELGPLRPLLEDAGRLEHDQRLDAAGLGRALVAAAEQLPRPAPLPLVGVSPAGPAAPADGRDATMMAGAAGPGANGTTVVQQPTGPPGPGTPGNGASSDGTAVLSGAVAPAPGAHPSIPPWPGGSAAPPPVVPLAAGARRRRRWVVPLAIVGAVALAVAATIVFLRSSVPSHDVPQALIGAQQADIADYVGSYGWRIETEEDRRDGTEPGQILGTDPEPGSSLREGATLTVTVSLGPTLVDVPQDLVGLTQDEAEDRLREQAPELTPEFVPEASEEVEEGTVIRLGDGVGEQAPKGSTIRVVVSSGEPRPEVPDVIGWSFDDARDELEEAGLSVERRVDPDADGEWNEVVGTDPEAGEEIDDDETVTVTVAGSGGAEVPDDLVGMDARDAEDVLEEAGLDSEVVGPRRGEVFATWPLGGSVVEPDTAVQLFTNGDGGD
jgi:beta-lactam-binding protein with PASTA domain/tRNA A-37 threonylcarbamoyl transferase component Bud32